MSASLYRAGSEQMFTTGSAGRIELVIDAPQGGNAANPGPRGIAIAAHPHPLYGGTLDNKVVQTLARTFSELGYVALRPNFRGVGESEGEHDRGEGETDDLLAVIDFATARFGKLPLVLGGFSFGAYIQTRVAARIGHDRIERLVLVALATGSVSADRSYATAAVPPGTILIHGEQDTTVPLANVFDWARPQDLPITVIPGADHFFHRKLHLIKAIIAGQWPA